MLIALLEKLNDFSKKHANSRGSIKAWILKVENATWKTKQDVLKTFPNAKMIANNRARFEIVHNTYRLIALIDYENEFVQVRFIGTHNEYERIDPASV